MLSIYALNKPILFSLSLCEHWNPHFEKTILMLENRDYRSLPQSFTMKAHNKSSTHTHTYIFTHWKQSFKLQNGYTFLLLLSYYLFFSVYSSKLTKNRGTASQVVEMVNVLFCKSSNSIYFIYSFINLLFSIQQRFTN